MLFHLSCGTLPVAWNVDKGDAMMLSGVPAKIEFVP
jgi:hypothetical protein